MTAKLIPQKYKWAQKKMFNNYNDANILRDKLKKDGHLVKVKRCGPNGIMFKVVVGTEIQKKNKNQKEATNATK